MVLRARAPEFGVRGRRRERHAAAIAAGPRDAREHYDATEPPKLLRWHGATARLVVDAEGHAVAMQLGAPAPDDGPDIRQQDQRAMYARLTREGRAGRAAPKTEEPTE